MKPHRATLILVLGILSIVLCQPLGIFAWVMGNADLKAIAAGTMDPSGKDMTNIGRILGIIGCVFLIVGLLIGIAMVVMGVGAAAVSASSAG